MESAIVGLVGALVGILLTNILRVYFDWRNRRERVRDIQTALRAEIRSHREALLEYADVEITAAIVERIKSDPGYAPLVTRKGDSQIFSAMVGEIHILPASVIDPVVIYYRQWRSLGAFVEDLRSEAYAALPGASKAEAFSDYLEMGSYAIDLADTALAAIANSLQTGEER